MFEVRGALEYFFGSGMKREDDGLPLGKFRKGGHDIAQALWIVRVFGAMDRGQNVALRLEAQAHQDVRLGRCLCGGKLQGIGHDVAGNDDVRRS